MNLTIIILLVLALYLLQLFLQETSRYGFKPMLIMGNRDQPPEPSVLAARLDRAKNNMLESLAMFLPLALMVLIRGGDTALATRAALVFLIARAAYVPVYASGIPVLRSIIWLSGIASMAVMAWTLA